MEIIKKLDENYRLVIPMELREPLGIEKKQEIKLYLEGNRIILEPIKNDSSKVLDDQKTEKEEPKIEFIEKPKIEESESEISELQKALEESYEVSKVEPIQSTNEPENSGYSNITCYKCNNLVEDYRLSKIKINGNPICSNCALELREELKRESIYYKRVKEFKANHNY